MDAAALGLLVDNQRREMSAVEDLLDAIERGDAATAETLLASEAVSAALRSSAEARLEVIGAMGVSRRAELEAQARQVLRAEPPLARTPFEHGHTLLHCAAAAWHVEFAAFLLGLGADPDACNGAGHPPLYRAANTFPHPRAAPNGAAEALVALFHSHGANLDTARGVKRCTPLHMAARRGHAEFARALILHGANIEARDSNGQTPLRRAVNCSHAGVARVLLAAGADATSRCADGLAPGDVARTAQMRDLFTPSPPRA